MQSAIAITIFWQARVGLKRLVLAAIIILSLAFPSQADLYRYRDRNGRLVMSSTPLPAGVGTVTTVPENTGSSMATTVPSATYKNKKNRPSKPTRRKHKRQQQKRPAVSRPVNTYRFGLLQLGSSQADVRRLLGPPAKRTTHGKKTRLMRLQGRFVKRKVRLETWYYPGTNRILPTQLTFYDGVLAEKDKEPRLKP